MTSSSLTENLMARDDFTPYIPKVFKGFLPAHLLFIVSVLWFFTRNSFSIFSLTQLSSNRIKQHGYCLQIWRRGQA